jgi:hypothetical protein
MINNRTTAEIGGFFELRIRIRIRIRIREKNKLNSFKVLRLDRITV